MSMCNDVRFAHEVAPGDIVTMGGNARFEVDSLREVTVIGAKALIRYLPDTASPFGDRVNMQTLTDGGIQMFLLVDTNDLTLVTRS